MNKGILITTYRFREDDALQEAWYLLSSEGYSDFEPIKFNMPGLVLLQVKFDPVEAAEKLIKIAKEKVWSIHYILKAIPLEEITEVRLNAIVASAERLAKKIEDGKSYRISVNKRNADISSRVLIEEIAKKVNRKVDLENFDYIIIIEILDKICGVSVLNRNQIFSLHKIRREVIKELINDHV